MKKVILVVLDGWGVSNESAGNAIKSAKTPNISELTSYYPNTALQASGVSVGLPWGMMGNSEVGHLTIGAGKVLYQNLPRVTLSIQNGTFFENPALLKSIEHAKENNGAIHVMGLLSDGGVHSHINHLYAILELFKNKGVPRENVFIHAFTDGRDVEPQSGVKFIAELESSIKSQAYPGVLASVMGRYFAMDRNDNWDRTQKAYDCMVKGIAPVVLDAKQALEESYTNNVTDEFIEPMLVKDRYGKTHTVQANDSVIFFNIREDRARQLTKAFVLPDFNSFERGPQLQCLYFACMVEYEKILPAAILFPPELVEDPLGKIISDVGLKQLRIAETEKYAHVTYFFNGGKEEAFPGEDRVLVPSPEVDFYDKTPDMNAFTITDNLVECMHQGDYSFIMVNYANGDMIGHTGNMGATIAAIQCLDKCIGTLHAAAADTGYVMLITADHGNCEQMVNLRTGDVDTEHSVNPVPFILVDESLRFKEAQNFAATTVGGMLSDIAPTVLDIMGIRKPPTMTGTSLLESI